MARMTQTEIIKSLADSCGCKRSEVKAMFDALTALAASEVRKNGEFSIPGFGKLKNVKMESRRGHTKESHPKPRYPQLKSYLYENIAWEQSGDPMTPFQTVHDGVAMKIRLNDFPAEQLYTLLSNGSAITFDEWPSGWTKSTAKKSVRVTGRSQSNGSRRLNPAKS